MKNNIDQTLLLRVQELVSNSEKISACEALEKALLDRYPTREAMAAAYAHAGVSALGPLRKSTYTLPEQPALFDVPAVISNNTPDGPLFIQGEFATCDETAKFVDEGLRHHSAQHLRFRRAKVEVKQIQGDLPGTTVFRKARQAALDAAADSEPEGIEGASE